MERDPFGIEVRGLRPSGWRGLTSEPVRATDKAIQCRYYGWLLWLPKARCLRVDGQLWTPLANIEAAKDHESAERS